MLKLKRVAVDTRGENVAFLARICVAYRPEEFQALKKIEVLFNGHRLLASLMIVDDESIIAADELGLSEQAFTRLGADAGTTVRIAPAEPPRSLDHLRQKIHGHTLEPHQLEAIISDIAAHR